MSDRTTNVIICGTGGQGTLLASEVLCAAALFQGFDVKKSEVHGMAQRGGSVSSHVRFGRKVFSPLVEKGTADLVLAMEKMEGIRWAPFLAPDGVLVSCDLEINPMTVQTGAAVYPDVEGLVREQGIPCRIVPAMEAAVELGNPKVVNMVLLGAIAAHLPIDGENWTRAIGDRVPHRALDVNLEAFEKGRAL